jgi:hypothetical protein
MKPSGQIEISRFGNLLESVGVQTILNANGVPVDQKIVDYIPVNDAQGNILAHSFRRFDTAYQGTAYWYRNDDGTREIRYRGFPIGYYTATLTLDLGTSEEPIVQTVSFVIFPWKLILGLLILAGGLGYGTVRYRRWSTARMKARLRAELEREKSGK